MGESLFDFLSSPSVHTFVFLGEAGCGKSELAITLALRLSKEGRDVSFFDLDMTKPLFRSRDYESVLIEKGVEVFYEEQFADAPTTGGWLEVEMKRKDRYCVLDVGGDYIGARAVGGCSRLFRGDDCDVYYVINPYRPWSDTIGHIDGVLSSVLSSSSIPLKKVKFIANPYLGSSTTIADIEEGYSRLISEIGEYADVSALAIPREMVDMMESDIPLIPVEKKIVYPW